MMNPSPAPSSADPVPAVAAPPSEAAATEVLVNGEPLKRWPQDLYIPPDALEVFLDTFQGPLDLLLYLIRRQNLDILDIPVAHITRQYMEYVEVMRHTRLDLATEYLVMAAILAEIKSRMLLPRPPTDEDGEEEDPRAALVRRLQQYERFSQAAQALEAVPRLERDLYLVAAEFTDPAPPDMLPRASLNNLAAALRTLLERNTHHRHWRVQREGLSVRERMADIMERLSGRRFLRFEELCGGAAAGEERAFVIVPFVAVLELVRERRVVVVQHAPFAPIHVQRTPPAGDPHQEQNHGG